MPLECWTAALAILEIERADIHLLAGLDLG